MQLNKIFLACFAYVLLNNFSASTMQNSAIALFEKIALDATAQNFVQLHQAIKGQYGTTRSLVRSWLFQKRASKLENIQKFFGISSQQWYENILKTSLEIQATEFEHEPHIIYNLDHPQPDFIKKICTENYKRGGLLRVIIDCNNKVQKFYSNSHEDDNNELTYYPFLPHRQIIIEPNAGLSALQNKKYKKNKHIVIASAEQDKEYIPGILLKLLCVLDEYKITNFSLIWNYCKKINPKMFENDSEGIQALMELKRHNSAEGFLSAASKSQQNAQFILESIYGLKQHYFFEEKELLQAPNFNFDETKDNIEKIKILLEMEKLENKIVE